MDTTICCRCKQAVTKRSINALGSIYHPEHFTCVECEKPIGSTEFRIVKNEPVCDDCYMEKHTSRCYSCGMAIMQRRVISRDRKWHVSCFRCADCSKSLLNTTFFEINGYLFCKHDYRKLFAYRCGGCAKPIGKNAIIALNTKWHSGCFNCGICSQNINNKFVIVCGEPVCIDCVSKVEELN